MAFASIGDGYQFPLFDFGAAFSRTAQLAARPTFELQFYNTQNAQLDALDREIAEIQARSHTTGATALLRTRVTDLERTLEDIGDFKTRTDARIAKITLTLGQLDELTALAAPGTVAEFDAKLTETIDTITKTEAKTYEFYGVNDRVRQHRADALGRLEGLVHNNFATQQDIDDVLAELATIRTNYLASQQIAGTNANLAYTSYASTNSRLSEIKGRIASINIDANADALAEIEERKQYYSTLLTILSLAFEASQNLTDFVGNAVQPQTVDPGSVLNLFS
jgi:hypothetical protein